MKKEIGLVIIAVVTVALMGAVWWFFTRDKHVVVDVPPVAAEVVQAPEPAASEPEIQNPIEEVEQSVPLPDLDHSDSELWNALVGLLGEKFIKEFLFPDNIVRHIVATIDNLPRQKLAIQLRPLRATPGVFLTTGEAETLTLDSKNFARYTPIVTVITHMDVKQCVTLYRRFYPLFQEAYRGLGYPQGHFNDRLIEVIDHLLATAEIRTPIKLAQPSVYYQFADPVLERGSAGQKILWRMGPEHAVAIKQTLRAVRAELASSTAH